MFIFQSVTFGKTERGDKQREFQDINMLQKFLKQNEDRITNKFGKEGYRQISEEIRKAKSV